MTYTTMSGPGRGVVAFGRAALYEKVCLWNDIERCCDEYRSWPLLLCLSSRCASVVAAKRSRTRDTMLRTRALVSYGVTNSALSVVGDAPLRNGCNEGYRGTGLGVRKSLLESDSSGRFRWYRPCWQPTPCMLPAKVGGER